MPPEIERANGCDVVKDGYMADAEAVTGRRTVWRTPAGDVWLACWGRTVLVLAAAMLSSLAAALADPADTRSESGTVSVRQFGAMGDGVTDDTETVQAAIDAVGKTGGTLLFPPGTYLVTSVGLHTGVRYLGYGATVKRPAKQGKWIRTFNAAKHGYRYSGDDDSRPITIEGLTFDGNRTAQGDYRQYQLEQAHLLFLAADPKRSGRLRVRILNCHFQNAVADAISLYTNVDAQIVNCTARDCFRGGLTVTGGYSRIQVQNFRADGKVHPTGIDVETDGPGFGGSKKIEMTLNGLLLPDGDFDIGVSDGSVVLGTNILARAPFNMYALDSMVRISNSVFGVGRFSGTGNRIVHPGDVTFQNCRFRIDGKSDADKTSKWAAIHVYWNLSNGTTTNQSLKLLDCDFEVASGIAQRDTTYAIYSEGDRSDRHNRLLVDGGHIPSAFTYGAFVNLGGTMRLRDVDIEAQTPMYLGSSEKWPLDALIDGVRIEGTPRYAVIPTHAPNNRITHRHVEIDESVNIIETRYGIAGNDYHGRRTITGQQPPSAKTHGLLGDVYHLKHPTAGQPCEWLCTRSGSGSGAIWKPLRILAP